MRRLLLISTSVVHGTGYLDHAEPWIEDHLRGVREILFVPYALHDLDGYAAKARERFAALGLATTSLHEAPDPRRAIAEAQAVFVGGGNTWRLLKTLRDGDLLAPLRERAREGMPYMGASAGSNLACPTIRTTNDMPIVQPDSMEALRLIPFQLNPHYLDADPTSNHMGETRETRLNEYLEENEIPVLGLREGAILQVRGDEARLVGVKGARLFRRGQAPAEIALDQSLDELLRG